MENYKEDTNQDFGTIFFIILFFLFALIFSGRSESQTLASGNSLQNELAFGNNSIHSDAAVFNAVCLPELYKNIVFTLHNTSFNLFSVQYKISNYNYRTTQNFNDNQKTRLVIEPLFLWRLYHPLSLSGKEDLPVLS
jgi:hypothetical protein